MLLHGWSWRWWGARGRGRRGGRLGGRVSARTESGGHSMIVTASTASFLWILLPGRSTSRSTCVMPALKPRKAVRCTALRASSCGKARRWPRCLRVRLRGRKASEPWRGHSYLRCDILGGGLQGWGEGRKEGSLGVQVRGNIFHARCLTPRTLPLKRPLIGVLRSHSRAGAGELWVFVRLAGSHRQNRTSGPRVRTPPTFRITPHTLCQRGWPRSRRRSPPFSRA